MRKEKMMCLRAGMLGALVALLVLGVGGELSAQPKAEPLPFKIGIVDGLTGPGFGACNRAMLGARYKLEEEVNKAGGINGHPVKLFIYDTGGKADHAAMLVERAATVDKVFAIVGPSNSSEIASGFPTANRLGVPDIATGGTIRGLCEKNAPWCFATMSSDDFTMEPLTVLIDRVKAKQIAVMADSKYNFAVSQAEWSYKIAERKGVKVLHDKGKVDVETGWADFGPQVTQIKSLRPDLICAFFFVNDLAHLAISLKGAGIDPKVVPIFSSLCPLPDFIVAAGGSAEGWYGSADFDLQSTDPLQQAWRQKLTDYSKTMTTDPGLSFVQHNHASGYDAAAFLYEAIRQASITPNTPLQEARAKIRDQLPRVRVKTYNSVEFRFGEGGRYEKNRLVRPMFLTQVQGGKMVTVGQIAE